jgi:hypothetical protein
MLLSLLGNCHVCHYFNKIKLISFILKDGLSRLLRISHSPLNGMDGSKEANQIFSISLRDEKIWPIGIIINEEVTIGTLKANAVREV